MPPPFSIHSIADDAEVLMPQVDMPPTVVWGAAIAIACVALVGLVMGLRQTPALGQSGLSIGAGDSPEAAAASATAAKPVTGAQNWSTLSGPQVTTPVAEPPKPKPAEPPPSSSKAESEPSAADDEAPPAAAPEAAPAGPPGQGQAQSPTSSNPPDSMKNYY